MARYSSSADTNQVSPQGTLFDTDEKADKLHLSRFGGINRLFDAHKLATEKSNTLFQDGTVFLDRLQRATVIVVGLGGVGSWAAEALCRSGIGRLVLIDLDDICISNTNRQMHALSSTVGKFKVDVMASRFQDLNPQCNVSCIHDFVTSDNVHGILEQQAGRFGSETEEGAICVLDAIDGSKEKSALLAACANMKIPVVTCGGAAGLLDPSQIVCTDLTRVTSDKLLSSCRRNLRKYHHFAAGKSWSQIRTEGGQLKLKSWNIPAIYSTERTPDIKQSPSAATSWRQCDGALGTACFVTGTFGFAAAAQIVKGIAQATLKPPRRNRQDT